MKPKILVLTGVGLNCEEETFEAYKLAGAEPKLHHVNQIIGGNVDFENFSLIHFTGGFSFGDHLGAGKVLANRFRPVLDKLIRFKERGGYILGVCNGFQVLVSLGLLGGNSVSLIENTSGHYQVAWHRIKINPKSPIKYLVREEGYEFPIRHAEGRLVVSDSIKPKLENAQLLSMRYTDLNPNGSYLNCAGLCDESGQIIGMMPHPENFISPYNHPRWPHRDPNLEPDGLCFFKKLVQQIAM
ncbi:MAG: phosphoribosylformylglycinamidine synthase subunit PurQ [Deltaproteobacteria bacterium]|nr:phosphoribosylformylglycinamidine synthase subunit PurQ [Deltaproteobacteria bacterium]